MDRSPRATLAAPHGDTLSSRASWLIILILASAPLLSTAPVAHAEPSPVPCAYFFYGQGCPHCANVEPKLHDLVSTGQADIHWMEVYQNRTNALLLNTLLETYQVPASARGVPIVFVGDSYLSGDRAILSGIESALASTAGCPAFAADPPMQAPQNAQTTLTLSRMSLATVIGAAIVDSINPCAIAVLLILLGALLAAGDRRKATQAGIAFTLSIYIAYFLFGLSLLSAIRISGLALWFHQTIGILAIIIGLANIKDYVWYGGGGFVIEIPRRWRPLLKKMLGSVTSPLGAFAMGFLVCLFELPCTGGPYIFILGLLAQDATRAAAIPILLLYNVFFVLPLVLITALIHLGYTNVEQASEWKERNIRILHLVGGLIMLALGIIVLTGLA
ncbi:hypothetical protein AUJ68_01965 [Candidatus Woesearchaeota archaeon CG1_02_57_44]|nr:MAG: hypothetical protein AUJ68_01965 [Candidatus Woesearchaeota archaeon CG1_02_57_44]